MEESFNIRRQVVEAGVKMLACGLTAGTWGNISARVPGTDIVAITPSGMCYDTLKPEDIVLMDLEGKIVGGNLKPSVEVPVHLAIYQSRSDVKAIIHVHSPYASALAVARKEIPGCLEDLVQAAGGNVRVNEYALPGTQELATNTVKAMTERNAVLLANHGMLSAGPDLAETFKICQIVEKAAQVTLLAQLVGGPIELSREDIEGMRHYYLHNYGQK